MYEFLTANALYVVLLIVLVIWFGIYTYLYRLEGKLKHLEELLKDQGDAT
ncbi:MAG TPA: CcmD family protein [Bacteroidota bacterium]